MIKNNRRHVLSPWFHVSPTQGYAVPFFIIAVAVFITKVSGAAAECVGVESLGNSTPPSPGLRSSCRSSTRRLRHSLRKCARRPEQVGIKKDTPSSRGGIIYFQGNDPRLAATARRTTVAIHQLAQTHAQRSGKMELDKP